MDMLLDLKAKLAFFNAISIARE